MFRFWMDATFAWAQLCQEAQEVMMLRFVTLAAGGSAGQNEAQRMVTEKGFALAEAMGTLALGGSPEKVMRGYRSRVRANKRRLSRR